MLALVIVSCAKEAVEVMPSREIHHGMIELGEKLEDPYTVENVERAVRSLYPTKADRVDIHPTDLYVRFLPATDADLAALEELGLYLMDHPMDYRIAREGDYYHDPTVADESITWQYAVVPRDFDFPSGLKYEILDRCYISEHDLTTRASAPDIDWRLVEREAFRLTGNEAMLEPAVKADAGTPQGRITLLDPLYAGGKPVGVSGVMVACNVFVKIATAYTDRDGYYKMSKSFSSNPRYRLVFKNDAGFSIGFNFILIPASVSTLGSGTPSGVDYTVTEDDDAWLFRRTAVNNAAWDYISRCTPQDLDISAPPQDLRIWILPFLKESSTPMLHHGTVVDADIVKEYVGSYAPVVSMFLPDMTIGTSEGATFADIYARTVHEMAHASHFSKTGSSLWTPYVAYILKSFVLDGGTPYGNGPDSGFASGVELFRKGAGMCEIGEMWAYFLGDSMNKERYGGAMPSYSASLWFRPEILGYLYERGFLRSEIFKALGADVYDLSTFKTRLCSLYPERQWLVNQTFSAYGK